VKLALRPLQRPSRSTLLSTFGVPIRALVLGRWRWFVVMDLGANDVLQAASQRDAEIKHPMPLQVLASAMAGSYRLYAGRDYVEFRRAR
jgi:hypothetical protein